MAHTKIYRTLCLIYKTARGNKEMGSAVFINLYQPPRKGKSRVGSKNHHLEGWQRMTSWNEQRCMSIGNGCFFESFKSMHREFFSFFVFLLSFSLSLIIPLSCLPLCANHAKDTVASTNKGITGVINALSSIWRMKMNCMRRDCAIVKTWKRLNYLAWHQFRWYSWKVRLLKTCLSFMTLCIINIHELRVTITDITQT